MVFVVQKEGGVPKQEGVLDRNNGERGHSCHVP